MRFALDINKRFKLKRNIKTFIKKVEHNLSSYYHVPRTASIFKQYSNHLLNHFNHCYFAPLSYKDQLQALEQAQIIASIRKKILKNNLIIRITDKGNNFYIGSAIQFEKSGKILHSYKSFH